MTEPRTESAEWTVSQIAERIRAEANIASRGGQYARLNQIALDLETSLVTPTGSSSESR